MYPKKRVLVVDDEREILEMLQEALEMGGFEVALASDGDEAIAKVSDFRPDAVVLDVVMPKENGYRVSRQIKTETSPSPKVVLLTGRRLSDFPDRETMFREFSMADDVLYKPVDLSRFVAHVRSLVSD